jgi:N-acetylglutamate synthase-like GNAT family acetyltransferase
VNAIKVTPIDLSSRLDDAELHALISHAVGYPTPEKLAAIMQLHREGARRLVGIERDARLVACLSYECVNAERTVIQHIAVAPDTRESGLGRALLAWLRDTTSPSALEAETDADAVDFYRECGFETTRVVDPRWPEVERWRCVLPATTKVAAR